MCHVQIGHQRTHPWANRHMSFHWQLWTIAVPTRAHLDHLLILRRHGRDRGQIHFLGSFTHCSHDSFQTRSTGSTALILDRHDLIRILIPDPMMASMSRLPSRLFTALLAKAAGSTYLIL